MYAVAHPKLRRSVRSKHPAILYCFHLALPPPNVLSLLSAYILACAMSWCQELFDQSSSTFADSPCLPPGQRLDVIPGASRLRWMPLLYGEAVTAGSSLPPRDDTPRRRLTPNTAYGCKPLPWYTFPCAEAAARTQSSSTVLAARGSRQAVSIEVKAGRQNSCLANTTPRTYKLTRRRWAMSDG
jgi:hypothetical protein